MSPLELIALAKIIFPFFATVTLGILGIMWTSKTGADFLIKLFLLVNALVGLLLLMYGAGFVVVVPA